MKLEYTEMEWLREVLLFGDRDRRDRSCELAVRVCVRVNEKGLRKNSRNPFISKSGR